MSSILWGINMFWVKNTELKNIEKRITKQLENPVGNRLSRHG